MKSNKISAGRILGIPISLDYSWFLVFILVTWLLAVNYFPSEFKNWTWIEYWGIGFVTSLLFFLSVLLHELGHSFVALKYKIKVKEIRLFIFGGIAEIESDPPKAIAEFWIAIAGPIVSFLLALIFLSLGKLFAGVETLKGLFVYLGFINLVLAIFNLIPGFPLDGGRVLRAVIWGVSKNLNMATNVSAAVGRFFGFLFILSGVFLVIKGNIVNGLWLAFIGWFLENASVSQVKQQALHEMLGKHKVFEAMNRNYGIVQSDITLSEVVDTHIFGLGMGRRSFLVMEQGKFLGLLTLHNVKVIPKDKWTDTFVTKAMIPDSDLIKVDSELNLWDALKLMDKDGVNQLPVTEANEIVGILTRESLITFIKTFHNLVV